MCQQWFSMAGLIAELVGFLLVALEWRHVFQHNVLSRQNAVEDDFVRMKEGEEAAQQRAWVRGQEPRCGATLSARTLHAG